MDELIQQWNLAGVRHLLVGGHTPRLLGMPRFTIDDLLAAKTASGRPQDHLDIAFLRELQRTLG